MDILLNDQKVSSMPVVPLTTVGQVKDTLRNWLVPQGITNYNIRIFFSDGSELAPVVLNSSNYDNVNFESKKMLINGGRIQIIQTGNIQTGNITQENQIVTQIETRIETVSFFKPTEYPGNFFSNYSKHPIIYKGINYPTSEHLFQAMKFMGPNATNEDKEYAEIIRNQNTPNKAKRLAGQRGVGGGRPWQRELNAIVQKYKNKARLRPDWERIKDNLMYEIVKMKTQAHMGIKNELIKTGNKLIVENSPRDSYWGIGSDGKGRNQLGKTWMRIRNEMK